MSDRVKVGQAGLGAWGQNLVRNVDDLADLTWICDASTDRGSQFARRFPQAQLTDSFEAMIADRLS